MSEPRKNHLDIDGAQLKEEQHADSYKPISEIDPEFRTSKSSLKSKEKASDPAEEKLLKKEGEVKIKAMSTEAKYDHRNGDTKIELDAAKKQFSGLTKEELMKYADDPFWVRLRWFMFVLFWALWLAMLAGAIAIILRAPTCAKPAPKTWYEEGPLVDYTDITPVDYSALEAELASLEADNIQGVFISPCENTYEVLQENSTCIKDFKDFLAKVQEKGIKFIVDLTANYVPTTHEWFLKSENNEDEFEDYFTWDVSKDSTGTQPDKPNNWVSTLDESAWAYSPTRKQYYLHQFGEKQADLNFHLDGVVKRFDGVVKRWRDAGVAGVRLVHARQLLVSKTRTDEPQASKPVGGHTQYGFYNHVYTSDQPELTELFQHWSHLVTNGKENVFTIREDGVLKPEWYKYRNASMLHPPAVAPLSLGNNLTAFAAQLRDVTRNWTALQLESSDSEIKQALGVVSILLPAAPVLTTDQFPPHINNTQHSDTFATLAALRKEQSIKYGERHIVTVPDNNSTGLLLCVARWKEGQPGYVAVFNPSIEPARADLTGVHAHFPKQLTVHYVTPEVRASTNYTKDPVDANNVLVPAKSSLVLSYVVDKDE